jgi:hypothetical protein
MPMSDLETRQIIRRNWLCALEEIADLELQRRTWVDPTNTNNPHWSYIEFICSYPSSEELADAPKKGYLSLREAEILTDFRRILVSHKPPAGDAWDNEAVLNDPAWHQVVAAARNAKIAFEALQP